MGFRSTFITEDSRLVIPQWFVNKWGEEVNIATNIFTYEPYAALPFSSKHEGKVYLNWADLCEDIQEVIKQDPEWKDVDRNIVLIFLFDCSGITKVIISKDKIVYKEPTDWKVVPESTHNDDDTCY